VSQRSKKAVDVVHLDFVKASDSVVHNKLIAKLIGYGLNKILGKWIECFLAGRYQFVHNIFFNI
jgi:hypothetical protein